MEKVAEESLSVENTEDNTLPKIDESRIDKTRLSKTKVHHVEKLNLDSPVTKPGLSPRKHYNPKP